MSKSALYSANTSPQVVSAGGTVSFGSAVRRFGCNAYSSSGNVVLRGCGYYDIVGNMVITNTSADTVTPTITFYKDGVAVPGATATVTLSTLTSDAVTVPFIVRETCDCEDTVTAIITGASVTVSTASVKVEKL